MKVLIIPEDPTHDPHIIKPIIQALFDDLGRKAWVDVLREPRLRGTSDALDAATIAAIVAENEMIDLFLLVVDRDCNRDGNDSKAAARAGSSLRSSATAACHAAIVGPWLSVATSGASCAAIASSCASSTPGAAGPASSSAVRAW